MLWLQMLNLEKPLIVLDDAFTTEFHVTDFPSVQKPWTDRF